MGKQVVRPGPERDARGKGRVHSLLPVGVKAGAVEGHTKGRRHRRLTLVAHGPHHRGQKVVPLWQAHAAKGGKPRLDHDPFGLEQGSVQIEDHRVKAHVRDRFP